MGRLTRDYNAIAIRNATRNLRPGNRFVVKYRVSNALVPHQPDHQPGS
jgi:hypothetical protein